MVRDRLFYSRTYADKHRNINIKNDVDHPQVSVPQTNNKRGRQNNNNNERQNRFRNHHLLCDNHHEIISLSLSPSSGSQGNSMGSESAHSTQCLLQHANVGYHQRQESDWTKAIDLVSTVQDNNDNTFSISFMAIAQYFKNRSTASHPTSDSGVHHDQEWPQVPKFGDWDEAEPKSGEACSGIFDKVKEERAASPPLPSCSVDAPRKKRSSFCPPKLCFFPFLLQR